MPTFFVSGAVFSDLLQDVDVAAGTDGSFVVIWGAYAYPGGFSGNRDHAGARRFSAAGVPLGSAVQVDTSAHVFTPRIATDPRGGYLAAWEQSGNKYKFAGQLLNGAGVPTGNDFDVSIKLLGEPISAGTPIGLASGPIFLWEEDGIWARAIDANRERRGGDIRAGDATYTSLDAAPLADGGFVTLWKTVFEVDSKARIFNAAGQPRGDVLSVTNAFSAGRVAGNPRGGFAIAGLAWNPATSTNELWAQQFSNDGAPVGPAILAHEAPGNGVYIDPDIEYDTLGNLFVVWNEYREGQLIPPQAHTFAADGAALGPEVSLSTQVGAGVRTTRLTNGNLAVAWYVHGSAFAAVVALCAPGSAVCGDGVLSAACEQCDDGPANSDTQPDACRTSCLRPACGDGVVDSGEQCDDGNTQSCDGCSPSCTVEVGYACGDGIRNRDCREQCDDGTGNSNVLPDACRSDCREARCGDGVVDGGEECDDGNSDSCDGCSFDCKREAGMPDANGNGVADACDACLTFLAPAGVTTSCAPRADENVTAEQAPRFAHGREEFEQVESAATGLGPVFNGRACTECHNTPTVGGASARVVTRIGALASGGGFDPLVAYGGPLLQVNGLTTEACSVAGEVVPPQATFVSNRNAPALFGAGLLEAIPEQRIRLFSDPSDRNNDGISGRYNYVNGRVGRFGWKAQMATLHDFAADAYLEEMGITTPLAPAEKNPQGGPVVCDSEPDPEDDGTAVEAFTDFMQLLAPPPSPPRSSDARRGRGVFRRLKCHKCHTDRYRTADFPIQALSNRRVRAYTDLLLHDMGSGLTDGIRQGSADGNEFRTPPLWGVRFTAPYLHDGRAATLEQAIAAHGGEAAAARDRFLTLTDPDRTRLIAFLKSL